MPTIDYSTTWGGEPMKRSHVKAPSQHLTGSMEFFKVTTSVDLTVAEKLDLLVQVISQRTQPIIQGGVKTVVLTAGDATALAATGATGLASGETAYTLTFANEHIKAWESVAVLKAALVAAGLTTAVELDVASVVL